MFIGATFVTIATAIPEVFVSVIAVIGGNYGIAVGNVIGGMTANIALVLAISMIFLPTSEVSKKEAIVKSLFMIFAFILVFLFSLDLRITWIEGAILIFFFVAFIMYSVIKSKKASKKNKTTSRQEFTKACEASTSSSLTKTERRKIWNEIAIGFLFGQVLIVMGAFVLVSNAERLADIMGISETVIGLTLMAFGASAPELTTVIASIRKKSGDMALGNILGSNIINSTLLLGILVMTSYTREGALPIAQITMIIGIPLLIGVSLLATLPMLLRGKTYRWQGIILVSIYALYITLLAIFRPH